MFSLKHETEFLNGDSAQLNDDAIKANAELEKLREQMHEQQRVNEELRKQLKTAEAQLKQGAQANPVVSSSGSTAGVSSRVVTSDTLQKAPVKLLPDAAAAANDEGMRLYKEKRYEDAAAKFIEASNLQPASALFANNAGFAFYRMEKYDEAAKWFLQTIALDPKRAVAYLNLGDAYFNLQRKNEAKNAYEKFLVLAPNSKSAPDVLEKMKSLP